MGDLQIECLIALLALLYWMPDQGSYLMAEGLHLAWGEQSVGLTIP